MQRLFNLHKRRCLCIQALDKRTGIRQENKGLSLSTCINIPLSHQTVNDKMDVQQQTELTKVYSASLAKNCKVLSTAQPLNTDHSKNIRDHLVRYRLGVLRPILAIFGGASSVISECSVCQKKGQEHNVEVGQALPQQRRSSPTECCQQLWQVMEVPSQTPPPCTNTQT